MGATILPEHHTVYADKLRFLRIAIGAVLGAYGCWLAQRRPHLTATHSLTQQATAAHLLDVKTKKTADDYAGSTTMAKGSGASYVRLRMEGQI
jgi:hypothetical protein